MLRVRDPNRKDYIKEIKNGELHLARSGSCSYPSLVLAHKHAKSPNQNETPIPFHNPETEPELKHPAQGQYG